MLESIKSYKCQNLKSVVANLTISIIKELTKNYEKGSLTEKQEFSDFKQNLEVQILNKLQDYDEYKRKFDDRYCRIDTDMVHLQDNLNMAQNQSQELNEFVKQFKKLKFLSKSNEIDRDRRFVTTDFKPSRTSQNVIFSDITAKSESKRNMHYKGEKENITFSLDEKHDFQKLYYELKEKYVDDQTQLSKLKLMLLQFEECIEGLDTKIRSIYDNNIWLQYQIYCKEKHINDLESMILTEHGSEKSTNAQLYRIRVQNDTKSEVNISTFNNLRTPESAIKSESIPCNDYLYTRSLNKNIGSVDDSDIPKASDIDISVGNIWDPDFLTEELITLSNKEKIVDDTFSIQNDEKNDSMQKSNDINTPNFSILSGKKSSEMKNISLSSFTDIKKCNILDRIQNLETDLVNIPEEFDDNCTHDLIQTPDSKLK